MTRIVYAQSVMMVSLLLAAAGCSRRTPKYHGPPADLKAAAAAHYDDYGAALAAQRRTAIPGFYHPDGAIIVFNGDTRRQTRAELKLRYEGAWNPPAFFAWESLAFDSIAPGEVLVTGGFRWLASGQRDTARFIYAGLVVAVDSGMGIVFEHETLRPRP